MKQVKVLIKDLNTLELLEDASKGDVIDLRNLQEVDLSFVKKRVNDETEKLYQQNYEAELKLKEEEYNKQLLEKQHDFESKLNEQVTLNKEQATKFVNDLKMKEDELNHKFELEKQQLLQEKANFESDKKNALDSLKKDHTLEIEQLNNSLKVMKEQNASDLSEQKVEYEKTIAELNAKLDSLKSDNETQLKLNESTLKNEYQSQIDNLKANLDKLKDNQQVNLDNELLKKEQELNQKHQQELEALKKQQEEALNAKDKEIEIDKEEISRLNNIKSSLSVKMIGEDLESWCDTEMLSYQQAGLTNCTWDKDNKVVKEEGEKKGSKADYIYKVYASNEHKPEELLASVCLDMKDEDPNSKNKQTNAHYFPQLDKNRIKKNCKYAVLVSTLESDKPNALPIYKVLDYNDMYVVQPAYMMTFLNMVTTLSMRFKDLVLQDAKEKLELKEVTDFQEEFDKLKNTYLDKPLQKLEKELTNIQAANSSIKDASLKIDNACTEITNKYIDEITKKLEKFDIKRLSRKLDKINEEE